MKFAKWLISICRIIAGMVAGLIVVIALFLFACYLGRQYEMIRVSRIYKSNYTLYEDVVSGNADIAYRVHNEIHYTVSKELLEIGVDDIYSGNENVFFEHKERVLWMCPQGIVYIKQLDSIPKWVILSEISGQWYYYRIVS